MSSLFRTKLDKKFDDRTARFHTSVVEDLRMFEEDIDGTLAHDIMLHEQGILEKEDLVKILGALQEIKQEWRDGKLEIGAEYEDVHEYIEARVIEKIGVEAGGMMHAGRSRNDQVLVDMKMVSKKELIEIAENILNLVQVICDVADTHIEDPMVLYTHGQHAQIGTFGHYLLAYVDQFLRDYQRIKQCYDRVNYNPLGAAAIGGTTLRISRMRTSELLGFDNIQENSVDATSSRDWAVESASVLSILMGNISRFATDIVMWSGKEFNYVNLSDEYSSSSSIMPQKKNPSTIELIRGKSAEVYGALQELMTMVKGLPTGYFQDLQQTKIPLWRAFDTTKTSVEVLTGAIKTMTVNTDTMLAQTKGSFIYAVQLAEVLAESELSFREAYKVTAQVVNNLIADDRTLEQLTAEDVTAVAKELFGKDIKVSSGIAAKVSDPIEALNNLRSPGSPHPAEAAMQVENRKELRERYWKELDFMKIKLVIAADNLKNAIQTHTA
ncbi:MAG: argininosuccinate lyase [Candidatus Bathyarchaeota archaeon]|nr:argininosuccinate lyase [Candidatus Bathyarchaeota archaeon]